MSNSNLFKSLGHGIGLRRKHFDAVMATGARLPDWFEIVSENFMTYGGRPKEVLSSLINRNIPLISHGVGLSLGSVDDFDKDYLKELKNLFDWINPLWFSDHLCFSSSYDHQYHDLLPVLRTSESLNQICDRIKKIEDFFQRPFAIENISYYAESSHNQMSEEDFINLILDKTNALLLLDINNVYVNSKNHNKDPRHILQQMNLEKVIQVHLAGHWDRGDLIIDTHGDFVPDAVWNLYEDFLRLKGSRVSTLIEWDNNLPRYEVLLHQSDLARQIEVKVLGA